MVVGLVDAGGGVGDVADVGDVRDSIALEVQLLFFLIVFCGRAGEETSAKVLRAFASGNAVFRGTRKNAGPSWNAGLSVKRRFANGRRERRASFRL